MVKEKIYPPQIVFVLGDNCKEKIVKLVAVSQKMYNRVIFSSFLLTWKFIFCGRIFGKFVNISSRQVPRFPRKFHAMIGHLQLMVILLL